MSDVTVSDAQEQTSSNDDSPPASPPQEGKKPLAVIVIGMAGSGKTTLLQRINTYVHEKKVPSYVINLDPAVLNIPYGANIDIRDTVNYKEVMKQYSLGPNGGILTALNLFATRFDQVLGFCEKRAKELDNIFIDTPGQIEIFTWSASGTIITESLASSFPTCVVYVVDTPRNTNPVTFMSNMTYACSIMYKTKLPFLIVFNKTDVTSCNFAKEWMSDVDAFGAALSSNQSYSASLSRSMALVLDEFYRTIKSVGVSAVTGKGMDEFFDALLEAKLEYLDVYLPAIQERARERKEMEAKRQEIDMKKLEQDLHESRGQEVVMGGKQPSDDTDPDPSTNTDATTNNTNTDTDSKTSASVPIIRSSDRVNTEGYATYEEAAAEKAELEKTLQELNLAK